MSKDPTLEFKDKLIKILERLLEEKITSGQHYKVVTTSQMKTYPACTVLPKIHTQVNPFHLIVDCTSFIAYKLS